MAQIDAKPMNKGLLAVMALTLGATAWTAIHDTSKDEEGGVQLASRSLDRTPAPAESALINSAQNIKKDLAKTNTKESLIPWDKLKRSQEIIKPNDVFKVHSWVVVPPVKKVKPLPPPPPSAPPAPFSYLGKLEDTPKGTQIFLMANNKLYTVLKGEKIDQLWRIDSEDANVIHLTYLPLGLPQTLSKASRQVLAEPPAPPPAELSP